MGLFTGGLQYFILVEIRPFLDFLCYVPPVPDLPKQTDDYAKDGGPGVV